MTRRYNENREIFNDGIPAVWSNQYWGMPNGVPQTGKDNTSDVGDNAAITLQNRR